MFLEFQESRVRDLNSTVDSTKTTEAGSAFQMGMVRGKNEYFRASEYVRYLVYCNSWDTLVCLSLGAGVKYMYLFLSVPYFLDHE